MRKKEIVLLINNVKFILPIFGRLIELYDNSCNFSIVTDSEEFESLMKRITAVDVIILDKNQYTETIKQKDIPYILLFVDGEQVVSDKTERLNIQYVNKYSSLKEIVNEITSCSVFRGISEENGISTKLVILYSPIGGSGTTTLALGLSAALTEKHKKVIYHNISQIQNFAFRFADRTPLNERNARKYKETDIDFVSNLREYIREEGFSYIPPFPQFLSSLDIQGRHIVQAISKIKETASFDYIIVDCPTDLSNGTSELMALADHVVIVCKSDDESIYKLQFFIDSVDMSNKDKYKIVSNNDDSIDNGFAIITDHVNYDEKIMKATLAELGENPDIEKLAINLL